MASPGLMLQLVFISATFIRLFFFVSYTSILVMVALTTGIYYVLFRGFTLLLRKLIFSGANCEIRGIRMV